MTLTEQLVAHVRGLTYESLPQEAREMARHVFLDGVGVTLAGATEPLGLGRLVTEYARESAGALQASVIGGGFKTSMTEAAFANGTMAHALDFDNTWYPMNHPTSPTLPTILAVAEHFGIPGRDCVTALVAAFEVQSRLRMASTGLHTGVGFHKPGTTGLMGAVAAGVHLFGLDERQAAMAFGTAGSRAGSLSLNTGTMTKSSHSGHAARMGLESALLAAKGWTATEDVFGPGGYFDTLLGEQQEPHLLVENFASPLRMLEPGVGFKKHPSNYFTHRPIDAALAIRSNPAFLPAQVESVTVTFPELHYVDRPFPESGLDGKFSVQYTTALALLDGRVTIDSFTNERRFAPDIEALLPKVRIEYDPTISKEFLYLHVIVTVRLSDGTEISERVDKLTGMPGVPLTAEQRMEKFSTCASRVLDEEAVIQLADLLQRIDELPDVRSLMDLARSDGSVHRRDAAAAS
ncbi:MmgE/PrpD family protein [Georgenia sp. 10Sc9-8]|uniref:MmgE/PrpD family protein n=1 Tax=Georgenia halotolerans TaxID=3028317 RepID=A0ABT5TZQ7_9MICO|nr:MmgE/PrpD family protein [Georgenia halotolerans]